MTQKTQFSAEEWLRYTRHIQLPQIGVTGQQKLKQSHALIVGAGGLGSPVSLYLAAAGVGKITLVDHDELELTNLQRQILYSVNDLNQNKANAGASRLLQLNPTISVEAMTIGLNNDNAEHLITDADIVLDCTDNFTTRYLINDTCLTLGKPWVYASIHQFSGQCALFTSETSCFRCLFPEPPENIEDCNSAGVIGVLPGILGSLQANEAIKYLSGMPTELAGKLLLFDAIQLNMQKINLGAAHDCHCLENINNVSYQEGDTIAHASCESFTSDIHISAADFLSLGNHTPYHVIDVRTQHEYDAFHLESEHLSLAEIKTGISSNTLEHSALTKSKKIACYCQSGARSAEAAALLCHEGYDCVSVSGGLAQILKEMQH